SLDPVARSELLESIHQEGHRLERLVRNLLDMTRLEAGSVRVRRTWTPVEDVVGAALTGLEEMLREREVATRLDRDLPPVPMDGALVEQVLRNLLENALHHTPQHTPIEIRASSAADTIRIEVADRGPGLAPDALEHVFEKFH